MSWRDDPARIAADARELAMSHYGHDPAGEAERPRQEARYRNEVCNDAPHAAKLSRLDDTADGDRVTRMTTAQLRDRINQMEQTAQRNSTVGAPRDRHRPMEDRARREKIALYRAELEKREAREAAEPAAAAPPTQAGVCEPCEGTGTIRTIPAPESDASTARGCTDCGGAGVTAPEPAATPHSTAARSAKRAARDASQARRATVAAIRESTTPSVPIEKCVIAEKCSHRLLDGHTCQRNAVNTHWHTGLPLCAQHAREARRRADAIAGKSPVPAAPEAPRTKTPAQAGLRGILRPLIREHSLPTLLDEAWAAAHELFQPPTKEEEARS